ncbi:MAG: PSD1 domain-containing protein [Verrucomicrobiaceae bacterium]|nr:PSD1 domain-containing protein [Verrucomicrobiaceae bacterium]
MLAVMKTIPLAAILTTSLFVRGLHAAEPADGIAFFEKNVRPVLISRCYECHSHEKNKIKGGLAMDSKEALLKGGDAGPGLVPGDPDKSKIVEAIRYENQDLQMPPKAPLPASERAAIEAWIKMGAPDPRTGAVAVKHEKTINIEEGRKHWAFSPLKAVTPPELKGPDGRTLPPIDALVRSKLAEKGLPSALPADRRTLIRRATFDLIGLPPTPEEVDAFEKDTSPEAFSRVIERLLSSPHYGERWGRHWLDVARYADSNGMDENIAFGHAWRYRDYVVRAFNDDKPFDQFVVEQIAGDLLPEHDQKARNDAITATGFLSLGARVLAEPDRQKLEMDIIDEQIDTLGKAFLGMTLGCVRCHDHKFDPITQADYYAMAAIFRSTRSLADEKMGAIKFWYEHSLATPEMLAAKAAYEKKVKERKAEVTAFIAKARKDLKAELHRQAADYLFAAAQLRDEPEFSEVEALAAKLKLRPRYLLTCRQYLARNPEHPFFAAWRDSRGGDLAKMKQTYAARFADTKDKAAQDALADIAGFLAVPDKDAHAFDAATLAKIEAMNEDAMVMEDKTPEPPALMSVADGEVKKTLPIHIRGSYLTLGKEVERGFPEVMRTSFTKPVMPAKQSGRLELARWLASSEHPLTARVFVNRLWRWHFGQGIVPSTDNFGLLGDKPSNPELLDYLARVFMENGWSIKDMHRLIMNSATYQQSSSPSWSMTDSKNDPRLVDPENKLLWRFSLQRLEAEEVRDAMLAVSGWLSPQIGGKTIPLRNREFVFNHTSRDHTTYETPRRALYLPIIRNHLYDLLEQFDFPDPTMPTGSRNSTVIAPQALMMLNAPVTMESAQRLAQRLLKQPAQTDAQRADQAYQILYSRPATQEEQSRVLAFVREVSATEKPERAWALVCQGLLAANEFMYLR